MLLNRLHSKNGFTLIEVVVVIVIIGILVGVAVQNGGQFFETAKVEQTKQELDALAMAITGNPELQNNGVRSDFGYVGDVGALPPNLDALYANPGYGTWNGPYISNRFTQLADDYKKDAWGTDYSYGGGVGITSVGSGSNIIRRVANSSDDLLYNSFSGILVDADGTPPGSTYDDSVAVSISVPDGAGGTAIRSVIPDAGGYFSFDSVPIGNHPFDIVYLAANDTITRFASVTPGTAVYSEFYLATDYWYATTTVQGLAGHWRLNESGGTFVSDASGNLNHGTAYLADSMAAWQPGKIDGALEFNGSSDYVQVPHSDELNGDVVLTYSAWAYAHTWSGVRQIMAKSVHGGGGGRMQMGIFSEGGQICGRAETDGGRKDVGTTLPATDTWVHVALVFDSTSLTFYIDGAVAETLTFSATILRANTDPLNFSKRVGTSQYYFDGLIDDVRVYTRALNALEVQSLFNAGN